MTIDRYSTYEYTQTMSKLRYCSLCNKLLTNMNHGGNGYYYCCAEHSKEARRIKQREKNRHYLYLFGKDGKRHPVRVNKRPRPNTCEYCGKERDRLHYHHWDDKKPEQGMWLCLRCHSYISVYERGFYQDYLKLKEKIVADLIKNKL